MAIGFLFVRPGNCLPEGRRHTGDDRIIGLSLIYAAEIPTNLFGWDVGHRLAGLLQCSQWDPADVLHLCGDGKLRAKCEGQDLAFSRLDLVRCRRADISDGCDQCSSL
jgi:hypothetical protein